MEMTAQPLVARRQLGTAIVNHRLYLLLALPGLIYFLVFSYLPMLGILAAFKDIKPFDSYWAIYTKEFVGFRHFVNFFRSIHFVRTLRNTLTFGLMSIVLGSPTPVLFALLLNEVRSTAFKRTVQTISYLPHFLSWVIVSGFLLNMLTMNGGIIPEIVRLFGGEPQYYLTSATHFRWIIVLTNIWKGVGFGTIIYLAAITSIDPGLYEAAAIDGAGRLRQAVSITIPSIIDIYLLLMILRIGNILSNSFEPILLLYSPAVYETADVIDTYVYRVGINSLQYSFSAAVGVFKAVVGLILMLITNKLAKILGREGIW